jgi:acetyl-CoA C-acetyltransferase
VAPPVYVVSSARTPIGKFGGMLAEFSAADLGVIAVRTALERAFGVLPTARVPGSKSAEANLAATPYHVDQLLLGNARPAGTGPNVARQVTWRAGLGDDVPAFTVNMACASGLRAILLGAQQIQLGEAGLVVAGGTESMSRVPYLLDGRWGFKMGHQQLTDAMYSDGLFCPMAEMVMGETAEALAQFYQIGRAEQDGYALESHRRAAAALTAGHFRTEIAAVTRTDKKGNAVSLDTDEHVRTDVTAERLAMLAPVFGKNGTITAGSSSGITDGAAAVVLASEAKLRELNLRPLARIVDATVAAVEPRAMGVGPVPAVNSLTARTGWKLADYDAIELNEAFAAQVLACDRELSFDRARLNTQGGAIALGHPIGCTGARIVTTLLHQLARTGGKRGLATLCVSGGMGVALALEMA